MASVRNITEHALELRCIRQVVEPDQKVTVPDDVFLTYTWPATVWDVTDEPRRPDDEKKPPAAKKAEPKKRAPRKPAAKHAATPPQGEQPATETTPAPPANDQDAATTAAAPAQETE